mgnify:FL=1
MISNFLHLPYIIEKFLMLQVLEIMNGIFLLKEMKSEAFLVLLSI